MAKKRIAAITALLALIAVAGGLIAGVVARSPADSEFTEPEEGIDSPRLASLANDLKAGDQAALDQFWDEMHGKAPLVEPVVDSPRSSRVTFVWRGDRQTRRMNVQGGPTSGDFANWMKRLGNTDLWYRTVLVPNDSRFVYFFQVNRPLKFPPRDYKLPPLAPPRADPLNPKKMAAQEASIVELSDAPPQPWLEPLPGLARRELKEHKLSSEIIRAANPGFDHERQFLVYTPPNYDPQGPPAALLVFFDGQGNRNPTPEMSLPDMLGRLIAAGGLPPLVGVFVCQTEERNLEVSCSAPFADFVAKELVPCVRKEYRVSPEPTRTIAGGISGGGLMAAYCGFRHSDIFGNVLSLSGGFGFSYGLLEERLDDEPGWLTRQFVTAPRLPVRFYLAAGSFENWFLPYNLLAENHRFRDVLEAKGYSVRYDQFSGGHDVLGWRGPLVEGLFYLTDAQASEGGLPDEVRTP